MDVLDAKLSEFVRVNTLGRDPSHGHAHMQKVASNVKDMLKKGDYNERIQRLCLIVAWLHDVVDHKFGDLAELRAILIEFLKSLEPEIAEDLMLAIDCVSFSKERKNGMNYYTKLLSPELCIVRDLCSDADKLEAIGLIGVERCRQYSMEKHHITDEKVLNEHVWEHAQEKLLIMLSDGYIKTAEGRDLAAPLHTDMVEWIRANIDWVDDEALKPYELSNLTF